MIDEILSRLDIVEIIWKYIKLKKSWRNYIALCPFHKEKTPSFIVSPEKQIFKCFWCWIWWNVIKFVMEYEKINFYDAVKILAKEAWVNLSFENNNEYKKYEKLENLYLTALNFFKLKLKQNEKALNYLKNERKLSDEIINKWNLWYAPESLYELFDYLLTFYDNETIKISWLITNWNYSFFKNRIIFPIYDHYWKLISFAWRSIDWEEPKYLNLWETLLYEKSKVLYWLNIAKNYINIHKKIFIVEWYMDVLAFSKIWIPIAVATCWTSLTKEHVKLLKRYTENIILLFDNDEAWKNASLRALPLFFEEEIYPKILSLEKYKDIDEAVNDWMNIDFLLDEKNYKEIDDFLINIIDKSSWNNLKESLIKIFNILSHIKQNTILNFYLEKIAKKINLTKEDLVNDFKKYYKKPYEDKKYSITYNNNEIIFSLLQDEFYKNYKDENIIKLCNLIKDNFKIETIPSDKIKEIQLYLEMQTNWTIIKLINNYLNENLKILPYDIKIKLLNEINNIKKSNRQPY